MEFDCEDETGWTAGADRHSNFGSEAARGSAAWVSIVNSKDVHSLSHSGRGDSALTFCMYLVVTAADNKHLLVYPCRLECTGGSSAVTTPSPLDVRP